MEVLEKIRKFDVTVRNALCQYTSQNHFLVDRFSLISGEQMALVGKSGSGKSSLLHLIAGFLPSQQGEVYVCDESLVNKKENERDLIRKKHIGVVFQTYQLMESFTVIENVLMGSYFSTLRHQNKEAALALLDKVELTNFSNRYPRELSVGQRQRVSIARALIKQPTVILADEPTGALDRDTGILVCNLLQNLCQAQGSSLIFVTHDQELAARFPKQQNVSELISWKGGAQCLS